jgi:hypothetical protein
MGFFLQNQGDVVRYCQAFDQLRAVALSPSDSRDRMRSVAAPLPRDPHIITKTSQRRTPCS